MRIAHVVERNAPTGQAWRLAAAIGKTRWLDLEVARRRLVRLDPELAHDEAVARQPITTLDDHLASRFRVADLRMLVAPWPLDEAGLDALDAEDDDLLLRGADLRFGPPVLAPRSLRDFYAFEGHVRTIWARRGQEIPEVWHRLPIFYFSNVSEIRGPGEPVWAPRGSSELDFELEVAALVDVCARDLDAGHAEEAIGGYMILNDWSARDLQREETTVRLGPAKGKDFASTIGPWLVTPDELADLRTAGAAGPDLEMTATVNGVEISRGRWCDARFSFGQMLERASADATVVPGDLVGSGTVGTGCLLEVRDSTLGRYLLPGDDVVLHIDRLGELRTPIIERLERPR
ncbi:MAG TPA: fumarylacetoacetate hydrolase family protein [Candidatus Saccharimonadales bacterium]|nr:fumarylacetoacetate hydrolase family protein [Candidatus Saccharimonadales bacterium]